MKKNLKELGGELLQIADKNSPALLTGCVVVGVVTTALLAWKGGSKAKKVMEDYKQDCVELAKELDENYGDEVDEETAKEFKEAKSALTGKMVWGVTKNVAPVVVMAILTSICAISANTVSTKRIAALTAAYSIAEKSLGDYTQKMAEMLPDKKVSAINAAIADDKVKADPPAQSKGIVVTGNGDSLCYDCISGRYFRSNPETIRQKVNDLNQQLMSEYYISLNEFYYMMGLPAITIGHDLGFCIDDGLLDVRFSSTLDDNNTPVLVLNYQVSPKYAENRGKYND